MKRNHNVTGPTYKSMLFDRMYIKYKNIDPPIIATACEGVFYFVFFFIFSRLEQNQ